MTEMRPLAEQIDRLLTELDGLVGEYLVGCQAIDKAYRREQQAKAADRHHSNMSAGPRIQPHPQFGTPTRIVRNAIAGHPNLANSVRMHCTRGRDLASNHPEDSDG